MFFDEITVHLKAGKGGDGCMSFRREKYIPKGGPNGGDGGRGGDITLICDHNVGDLTKYHFKNHYEAKNGEPGRGNQQYGHYGASIELPLPPGTIVYDVNTGRQVAELLEDGQTLTLLKGGKGGLGNMHFRSSTNQAP
ncbi:MAG: GTPase ObgE, partial [Bdellovibrionales bacterium]|nr:GTPase ObgE [Bdellovibrionales bacterium]